MLLRSGILYTKTKSLKITLSTFSIQMTTCKPIKPQFSKFKKEVFARAAKIVSFIYQKINWRIRHKLL